MAQQSRIGLQTDINADIADNTTADISPADVRLILTDINDSAVNKLTDTNLIGWYEFDATKAYYTNELVIYSDNLYKFNQNHAAGAWNTAHADLAYFNGATQFSASLTISSADVKTLNSVPKTLVTCPTGRQIIVTGASLKCGNGNTAYLVETDVIITTNTATKYQVLFDNILTNFTTAGHIIGKLNTVPYVAGDTQILPNQNLVVTTPTADPTTGNYNITLYVTFRMV